ncbi:MAG: Inorganic triphosphatase [Candidatus Ordinivivax streblomastigis]|uniref:Inorganic triphosphatase n=1 Tax=Candidatus Ordinivivax streblomastigis TaxID=2540710 RepID=A0A5M8P1T8_9BACT|nr:MAG: Inorganic triphosphatase [Candidatus Ordinivivax streblomastigis]
MAIEIERKFLIQGDFKPFITKTEKIVQAYLITTPERTVRIRIKGNAAYLTIKGASNANGFSRLEFEYPIPVADAEKILPLAQPGSIEKDRHYIPFKNHLFEVDVFHGNHEGLILAELELQSENEVFERPDWLGQEVTGDERYYNAWLSNHEYL